MKNNDTINENQEIITKNSGEKTLENKVDSFDLPQEEKDKLETKGLKLKKTTKERLNSLQASFDDAESMIVALLNQYEVFKLESNDKFSEENGSLSKKIKENEIEVKNKVRELEETKESFTRVNLALTTVEKELNEKSKIIENLQLNIVSLSDISKEDKAIKEENSELRKKIKLLEEQLTKNKIEFQRFEYLKSENERYIVEISDLRKEKNEYKVYSNELNNKIQEILLEKANEIAKLNNEKNRVLKESQEKSHRELMEANNIISKLKDELYELKLTLNQWNTK